jgi:hypothetical protein
MAQMTSDGPRSGVADSIEQHRVNVNEPGWPSSSWRELNTVEYAGPTVKKEGGKRQWLGMEAGIAKKPGNAGGVKVSTACNRGWTNICYTQR